MVTPAQIVGENFLPIWETPSQGSWGESIEFFLDRPNITYTENFIPFHSQLSELSANE